LSKFDINELKSLRNPPNAIKLLMECICLILGVEPIKAKSKDPTAQSLDKDYWTPSIGK
jgi:dynein heavy chain, axonemal